MEAIFVNRCLTTASGKVVYEFKKRVTNQQILHECLQDLKHNVRVRTAIKEQPQLDI